MNEKELQEQLAKWEVEGICPNYINDDPHSHCANYGVYTDYQQCNKQFDCKGTIRRPFTLEDLIQYWEACDNESLPSGEWIVKKENKEDGVSK